jgi:hypothetical protein
MFWAQRRFDPDETDPLTNKLDQDEIFFDLIWYTIPQELRGPLRLTIAYFSEVDTGSDEGNLQVIEGNMAIRPALSEEDGVVQNFIVDVEVA